MKKTKQLGLFAMTALASAIAVAGDNYVELGAGYLSDDGSEARQYSGVTEEGAVPLASFGLSTSTEEGAEITVEGKDLGQDNRSGSVELKHQGKYEIRLEGNSIPHLQGHNAVSKYAGAGEDHIVDDDLRLTGHKFDLETRREKVQLSADSRLGANWKVTSSLSQETKQGTEVIGGSKNSLGYSLPAPVDYTTDTMRLGLHYVGKDKPYALNFDYAYSSFKNGSEKVTVDGFKSDGTPASASLYLEPDNYAHMLSMNGVYRVSPTARLSMNGRKSFMRQDQSFDTFGHTDPNRDSVEAKVDQTYLNLAYTDRLTRKANVRARYTFKERENDTPVSVIYDDHANRPFSSKTQKFDLEGGYRLTPATRLIMSYSFEDKFRKDDYLEVEDTDTHSLEGKATYRKGMFNGALSAEYKERRGDNYVTDGLGKQNTEDNQNNELNRRFFLADLDETRIRMSGNYQFTQALSGSAEVNFFDQQYLGGASGLKNSAGTELIADVSYMMSESVNLFTYASGSQGKGEQAINLTSNDEMEAGVPASLGTVDATDTVVTFGLGGEWSAQSLPLSITVDYSYSDARSEYDMFDPSAPTTNPDDLTTRIHYFSVEADYKVSERLELKGIYSYEDVSIADFGMASSDDLADFVYLEEPDSSSHFVGLVAKYYLQ